MPPTPEKDMDFSVLTAWDNTTRTYYVSGNLAAQSARIWTSAVDDAVDNGEFVDGTGYSAS